jgi:two-component system, cell cycle sensor histidine kinase and response regulator CckA
VDAFPKPVSFETARLALAHLNFDGERERNAALERAARICSSALGVDRVGVWLLEPGTNQLVCPNLFDRAEGRCRVGETIELDLAVAYRDALFTRKVIVAEDAQHAPATSALTDTYLRPLGITSKLDAPIFREGEVVGVVCLEHVGPKRVWSDSECTFASSVADMLGMLLEQTARRVAEVALRDRIADEADHQRHALIGQIAAGLAHDFANVIQGISLAVAHLPRAGDAERARLQADLTSWTRTGAEMVQRLKDFATASRHGDRCDASDVLFQLGAMLTLLCKETAELQVDVARDPAWAAISRTDLERVVLNLVLNARDAIAGRGQIMLRLRSSAEHLAIEVSDNGEGISQELLVQVFQPYFTTKALGTGLGLATVRTIVEGAGGHISVTSEPDQGSRFTVVLRRVEPPAAVTDA